MFLRFSNQGGQLIKDANFFSCTQSESNKHLVVPITVEDEVSFTNKYSLIVTINHSDNLSTLGHYWAFIMGLHSPSWYSCNDKLILNVEERSLNNTTSYIHLFTTLQSLVSEKHGKGAWSSMVLPMRSNDLTYDPNPSNS